MLAGALRPMAGSVRIGGTDPHALRCEDLVAGVTLMEQDSQLLSGTVAENLRLGRIIAAIHDRTLDHLPMPADATVRLAAGRVRRVT